MANPGDNIAAPARYVQHRVLLATGDPQNTPELDSVTLSAWPVQGGLKNQRIRLV